MLKTIKPQGYENTSVRILMARQESGCYKRIGVIGVIQDLKDKGLIVSDHEDDYWYWMFIAAPDQEMLDLSYEMGIFAPADQIIVKTMQRESRAELYSEIRRLYEIKKEN